MRDMVHGPMIETPRLNVFRWRVRASDTCSALRRFYVAYHRYEDQPEHVVTATVMEPFTNAPAYLDWIETNVRCRRQGLARELFDAIEKDIGQRVYADGATDEGDAFCNSLCTPAKAPAKHD